MERPGVHDLLREFQEYVLAYRLRAAIGGRVAPPGEAFTLAGYAARRIERQTLARDLIGKGVGPADFGRLDRLTDELMFGFWYNPREVADFLTAVLRSCPHPAIADANAFAALLSPTEDERLGPAGVQRVVTHHLTCLTLASPIADPVVSGRVWSRIDATQPPLFIDELARAGQLGGGE